MSKLKDSIKAKQTGRLFADIPIFQVTERYDTIKPLNLLEYEVGVSLVSNVVAKDGKELEYLKERTKTDIIEFVFGEFRQDLSMIRLALSRRDHLAAEEHVDKLYKKMFD